MNKPNSLHLTRKRLLILLLSIAFLFCSLIVRLGVVQLVQGRDLQSKAAEQWYRDLPLEAPRGRIYDVNKAVLADNYDVYTVYVRPRAVKDPDAVATLLSSNLDLDKNKLYDKITTSKVSEITILRQVEEKVAKAIKTENLAGIYFTIDKKRNYPMSAQLSQILGFTNIDNDGQNGIEGYYDKYLKGVDGFAYTATDIQGIELPGNVTKYVPAIPGCDVTLTIDANIQAFAEEAVNSAHTEWNSNACHMVVMDVNSGGILAMASSPSYDNNDPPRDDINLLNALSKNKMIVDVYEPGSTFKIFTLATALENGVVNENERFFCAGNRVVDGQRIRCWRTIGHGSQSLGEGVMNSCNCVFMDLALRLGTDKLYQGLKNFGFGSKTDIDFFGESRGLLMNQASVKTVDLARIGFGQAVAVTPLQLITGVCAAVNGGTLYKPYFVKSIDDYAGTNIFSRAPQKVRQVVSASTSSKLRRMLEKVVSEGGGKKAGVAGFSVGGKTGTAQKYKNGIIAQGKYVSSFVGFAPADNPKYALLMLVDEPQGYMYYGSLTAAPYAGRVFGKLFDYVGMKPAAAPDLEYLTMPHLDGGDLRESVKALEAMGFSVEVAGEGEKVYSTVPIAGEKVAKGDVVLIRTD